jgi:hypothetical protein
MWALIAMLFSEEYVWEQAKWVKEITWEGVSQAVGKIVMSLCVVLKTRN